QVRYEVLLVADAEVDPAMAGWLQAMAELETSLLRVPAVGEGEPTTLLDNAAAQARGDYLLLFSTTLEPLGEQWLAELLQHAQRPEVAVVGGKQVDARGRVVDAGTVLGVSSVAGPAFAGESVEARGYLQRLQVVQNWSAVSGDCLLVRKAV